MSSRVYKPDTWVMVEFFSPKIGTTRKILAGFYGGYLTGDSWQLSSGVESVHDKGDFYEVKNASGSVYLCNKASQKLSGYTSTIYSGWEEEAKNSEGFSVRIVDTVPSNE